LVLPVYMSVRCQSMFEITVFLFLFFPLMTEAISITQHRHMMELVKGQYLPARSAVRLALKARCALHECRNGLKSLSLNGIRYNMTNVIDITN